MKDIVENRRLLSLRRKAEVLRTALQQNGPRWALQMGVYYAASKAADAAFRSLQRQRETGAPGINSLEVNRQIWEGWDWQHGGEEWTVSPAWKASLLRCVLEVYVPAGGHVLEIGPGAGRWTEALVARATRYSGVDISERCVALCRDAFAAQPQAAFYVTSGSELGSIDSGSVDAVWSYDVFVHINQRDAQAYAHELRRVLRAGGRGAIQHGAVAGAKGGWRSDVTTESFAACLRAAGLTVTQQFDHWQDGPDRHRCGLYDDVITVFEG